MELPAAIQFLARIGNINIHFDPSVTFTDHLRRTEKQVLQSFRCVGTTSAAEDALQEVLDITV
jgi:hypothetical protein